MCGIVAYIGARPANPFILRFLLMQNEERGGDATGWVINNKITKNTDKVGKFLSENKMKFSEDDENFTFIGHTRKSSIGSKVYADLAHPFGIYKNSTEKENYDLVLAMNGTLNNHDALAKKYEVPYTEWTNSDTQVVAKIMAKLGEKEYKRVLEEYRGWMTLVFFSPKHPNTLMVYKDPDRPLFMWQKEPDEIYISSIEEALLGCDAPKDQIFTFDDGFLHRLVKGKVVKKEKIERNPLIPTAKNVRYNDTRSTAPYEDDYYSGHYPKQSPINNFMSRNKGSMGNATAVTALDTYMGKTKLNRVHTGHSSLVYVVGDRYHRNGHAITGKTWVEKSGKVLSHNELNKDPVNQDNLTCLFTLNGYKCRDEKMYDALTKECSDINGNFQLSKFKGMRLSQVVKYMEYPAITMVDKKLRFVLPPGFDSKVSVDGDEFTYEMFLGHETFRLVYEGLCVPVTGTTVCNLKEVTDNSAIILNLSSSHDPKKYLISEFENNQVMDHIYYFNKYRLDYLKQNKTEEVRKEYYHIIVEIMLEAGIIPNENVSVFKAGGTGGLFVDQDYLAQIQSAFVLYKKALVKEIADKEDLAGNLTKDVSVVVPRKLTTIEHLASLKDINELVVNNDAFRDDVFQGNYNTLDKLANEHGISTQLRQRREFYEAVVLLLTVFDYIITPEEGLKMFNLSTPQLEKRTEELYNKWIESLNSTSPSFKKEVEDVDVEEMGDIENQSPEDFEGEVLEQYNEVIELLKDRGLEYEGVQEELKTDKAKFLIQSMVEVIGFMEKEKGKKK